MWNEGRGQTPVKFLKTCLSMSGKALIRTEMALKKGHLRSMFEKGGRLDLQDPLVLHLTGFMQVLELIESAGISIRALETS